jgi:predicted DNA-binding protein YlxM (UPF0122 family)
MSRLVKPIEYAKAQGISRQAVYAKIKKGALVSKSIDGKIYIVLEDELHSKVLSADTSAPQQDSNSSHLIDVKELLQSKDQTITVLKESISDLKQTNTEINTTLRGEIELLKQVFTEMRNLYVKQVDYMNRESKLVESKISVKGSEEREVEGEEFYDDIVTDTIPDDEEECWITLEEFFERSKIEKPKRKTKIISRLKKAYKSKDSRIKVENKEIYISCYHFYDDILKKKS